MKERDKRAKGIVKPIDNAPATAGEAPAAERVVAEPGANMEAFLNQTRQPMFVDSAYFLRFKFEQGKYAFVGREQVEGPKRCASSTTRRVSSRRAGATATPKRRAREKPNREQDLEARSNG